MAPPLARGANVALTRENPSLRTVVLGVHWDAGRDDALEANLVAAALLCGPENRILSERHFVFFNQLVSADASTARRDELLGDDQEQIEVDLDAVPAEVERIVVALYLNEGSPALRTLGQLRSLAIRVLDAGGPRELARSEDLASALSTETAVVLGHLYRYRRPRAAVGVPPEWRFRVVGQGYGSGLEGVAADYGVPL